MSSPTKKFPWLLILLLIPILGGAAVLGVIGWKKFVVKNQDVRLYDNTRTLIQQHRDLEAIYIIDLRNRTIKSQTPESREKWFDLQVEALGHLDQVPRLVELYLASINDFYKTEERGLIMGRAILHRQDMDAFDVFRAGWRNRESNQSAWFILDADALLLKGKRAAAIKMLNSRSFPGPKDSDRLMRLAMLDIPSDIPAAWGFLDQAVVNDPHNPQVRLFRGEFFESYGYRPQARVEYVAAFLCDTNNTDLRDRLGEFYRRSANYDLAVKTWQEGVNVPATSSQIWLKAIFWSRVARDLPYDWKHVTPPNDDLKSLLDYLLKLPPGKFWDDTSFERLSQARRYTSDQQAVYWLKLIAALQAKNEPEAERLLQFNKFRQHSWNLPLEGFLLRALVYRKTGELKFPVDVNLPIKIPKEGIRPDFLDQLDIITRSNSGKGPPEIDRILRSDFAFSLIFLLNGWTEAAVQMQPPQVLPADFPDWVAYAFVQAYYHERGPEAALAFAARQKSTPLIEVLAGEILVDNGKVDDGLAKLTPFVKADSDVGLRAATDLAKALINRKEYDQARAAIDDQPRLRDSLPGKELLAGVDLMQGRKADAEKIYQAILEESDDAKIYFGKLAFDHKDWPTAHKLTEQLIDKYPDRMEYRENLQAIMNAEKGQ